MKRTLISLVLVCGAAAAAVAGGGAETVVNQRDGVAIKGYDVVAYFTLGAPTRGSEEFVAEHEGAEWHFATAAHRDSFLADPERYTPAYGGYCAWAMSEGNIADIDPTQWVIHDGRLYLNFDARTSDRFEADLSGNISKADGNWPRIKAEIEER